MISSENRPRVAYFGSRHHLKTTGSALFLLDLLHQWFDVDVFPTDDWIDRKVPRSLDLSGPYEAVLFWQSVPFNALNDIPCLNRVFFPMYDQCGSDPVEEWIKYKSFKIIAFSQRLAKRLKRMGLRCWSIQYFPKPEPSPDFDPNALFFWQRRKEISWAELEHLFPPGVLRSVHWHRAMDFGETIGPSEAYRSGLDITESNWFSSQKDYQDRLSRCGLFLAPRMAEGIGFSFLEAMARNMIVVAHDDATMNEYIRHGQTGFLFQTSKVEPVNLASVDEMRVKLSEYMTRGYEQWLVERAKIQEWILSTDTGSVFRLSMSTIVANLRKFLKNLKRHLRRLH